MLGLNEGRILKLQSFGMAVLGAGVIGLLVGCRRPDVDLQTPVAAPVFHVEMEAGQAVLSIVAAARDQIGWTILYDPAYVGLAYPGGDVPIERGVCTDVVVRALRQSLNMDLQQLVHEDMTFAFSHYPRRWGLMKPDRNIDHRRVPNLMRFFERKDYSLEVSQKPTAYAPGDLVTCMVAGKQPHIMIVSDRKNADGVPLVIHNIGSGTREEDRLFSFTLTGHYRIVID